MIIKMVTEFKVTVVNFARPNQMQICACAWIYRWTKKLWKISTGPPGRWAVGLGYNENFTLVRDFYVAYFVIPEISKNN